MPTVAIVGASANPERYSHQAVLRYLKQGWQVWPIHPTLESVAGIACLHDLAALPGKPDIISMYVNPGRGIALVPQLAAIKPSYLWLNPGSESEELVQAARGAGLTVIQACNLVALSMGDPRLVAERVLAEQQP